MTVSAILNRRYTPRRKDAVQRAKRIRRIARELGYRPNAAARTMASGRFGAVALLMSADVSGRSSLPGGLLRGLTSALDARGMYLAIADLPDERLTDERFVPKILREWMSDGLLINYNWQIPARMIEIIEDYKLPSVWLNCKREHDCVYPDDFDAARRLTSLLISRGHRRIAYADFHHGFGSEPDEHYSKADRWSGYWAAMAEAGLTPMRIDTGDSPHRNRSTYEFWAAPAATCLSAQDRPTAVIGYSHDDLGAFALAARGLGLRVPDGLALATFGEGERVFIHGLQVPAAQLPEERVGRTAVERVLEKIESPLRTLVPVSVPFDLNERGLVGPRSPE